MISSRNFHINLNEWRLIERGNIKFIKITYWDKTLYFNGI